MASVTSRASHLTNSVRLKKNVWVAFGNQRRESDEGHAYLLSASDRPPRGADEASQKICRAQRASPPAFSGTRSRLSLLIDCHEPRIDVR